MATCDLIQNSSAQRVCLSELYSTLCGSSVFSTSKLEIESESMNLGYFDFCAALREFDPRFSTSDIDEMLTLALLVDTDSDGCIAWDDFYSFCSVCSEASDSASRESLFYELLAEKTSDLCSNEDVSFALREIIGRISDSGMSKMRLLLQNIDSHDNESLVSLESLQSRIYSFLEKSERHDFDSCSRVQTVMMFPDILNDQLPARYIPDLSISSILF